MRIYSAGEAIGPAWEHTKALLWADRSWKRLLKICLVAIFAELGGINLNGSLGRAHGGAQLPAAAAAMLAVVGVVLALFSLVVGLVLLYVGSRLQFVLFDMLVLRDHRVAPSWQRHGRHTWRWIGIKLTAALAIGVALSPLLLPAFAALFAFAKQFSMTGDGGQAPQFHHPPVLAIFLFVLEFLGVIMLFVALLRFFTALALPVLALEDTRYTRTFRRAWQIFRSDVGGMLLFAVLEPLLLFVLGLCGLFAVLLAVAAALLPLLVIGLLLWAALHKAATFGQVVVGIYAALALLVLLVWMAFCYVVMLGALYSFARAWSLYFLGGRYPTLGQYMQPEPAGVSWTPPPSLPSHSDDEDGLGMPLDPVLA